MKKFIFTLAILVAINVFAMPTISYPTKEYKHSSNKLSGLKDAGSLTTKERIINHVEPRGVIGQPGEGVIVNLVVDDPDKIEKIEFVKCVTSEEKPFKIVFSNLEMSEPVLSKMLTIHLTMPEESTVIEYTLRINGTEIRLPIVLLVK